MEDVPPEIRDHYETRYDESARLESPLGHLELTRTLDIVSRHVAPPPARIIDVGGGPGAYAVRLAERGYDVELIEPVERHRAQAERRAARAGVDLTVRSGTAADLHAADGSVDAVLLLGPLYHLTEAEERVRALAEARRVLAPGGVAFAAAISRFASLLDSLDEGFLDDPQFVELVIGALRDGIHRNPTGNPRYFTTAYFHHPDELAAEMVAAGFTGVTVYAVEGPGWAAPDLDARLADPDRRAVLLGVLQRIETEPALLGMSPHLLAVGHTGEELRPG